jgi:hypothetical protein
MYIPVTLEGRKEGDTISVRLLQYIKIFNSPKTHLSSSS